MPHPAPPRFRVAVLGGGITGLAAAYALSRAREQGTPVEEFLIERGNRLGGMIQTERVEDFLLEAGPDAFLTERSEATALCAELGLGNALMGSNDAHRRTHILFRSRLVPLPEGFRLFIPLQVRPALRSPLIPVACKLAILREAFLSHPHRAFNLTEDESVASFVRRRFGNGMLENIAEPLLAGIYGGDPERLSLRSVLPRLHSLEPSYRRGAPQGASKPQQPQARPFFTTLREGLGQLTEALVTRLGWNDQSSRLHLNQNAEAIEASSIPSGSALVAPASPYTIHCTGGRSFAADAVILCLPASECAGFLAGVDSSLAGHLATIASTPAVTVALGYRALRTRLPLGFGFLVPRRARRHLLACTFSHIKFEARAPEGGGLLRCFLGGTRNPEAVTWSDHDLLVRVTEDLRIILGVSERPSFHRIYRWPSAMPQYLVGHEERVRKIEQQIKRLPGLYLAGNAYSGVGISDCIRSAKSATDAVLNLARRRE